MRPFKLHRRMYEPCVKVSCAPFGGWWLLRWSRYPAPWQIVVSNSDRLTCCFKNKKFIKREPSRLRLFQSNKMLILVILGAHWNLIQTLLAVCFVDCRQIFIILQKVIRCRSFLMMPTMTQSGSCIDPCKEIYSLRSRCRLKVFEILLRLLFFPSYNIQ